MGEGQGPDPELFWSYSRAQLSNLIQPEIGESQQRWGRREGKGEDIVADKKRNKFHINYT